MIYNMMGVYFYSKSFYDKSVEEYLNALRYFEQINNERKIQATSFNIALIYLQTEQFKKAEEYWIRSLKSARDMGNDEWIIYIQQNLGMVYIEFKDFEKAITSQAEALSAAEKLADKKTIGRLKNTIATIHKLNGENNKALALYKESLKIAIDHEDIEGELQCYKDLGALYLSEANYPVSIRYLERCKKTSLLSNKKQHLKESYELLARAYESTGRVEDAYESYKQYIIIKDSVFNAESSERLTQVQLEFEFDKIQQKKDLVQQKKDALSAAELKRQKLMRNAGIIGVVLLLILAYVLYNRYRLKKRSNKQLQDKNQIISEEKKKSEDLLHNILPVETANELKTNGKVKARKYDMVSVGFTDFKGFTMLSEKLTPEELVDEIDRCFTVFDDIMAKHGLEKIKTIGDAYMFAGGIPGEMDNHPLVITKACLDIRDAIEAIKQEKISNNELFFEIRIGVHTGPLVAGVVGNKKFAYDIWGDTVNTAARMESSGDIGKVNVSGTTYELIKDYFKCDHRGKIPAKNKGDIDMYFIEPKSTN
jgi:class 3 adenylate cyclase/Tfp pilus assembly protein PilF